MAVDHTTMFRWVQRYAPEPEKYYRPLLKATNDSYRVDEPYRYRWRVTPAPRQRGQPRHASVGTPPMHEPSRQSIEIERGGTRHLPQVRIRQADIAPAPESKRPYTV